MLAAMNVATAKMERRDIRVKPATPWPDVQPEPSPVPNLVGEIGCKRSQIIAHVLHAY